MERSLRAGSAIFAVGMAAMGVVMLARLDVPPVFLPLPPSLPGRVFLAGVGGAWLIAASVPLLINRRARSGALAIAALLSVGVLLHIRPVLTHLQTPAWAVGFETVVLASTAWMLVGMLDPDSERLRVAARWGFGTSLVAFGMFHFLYHAYIEKVVPAWIPAHTFWTFGLGAAMIAAGLAILTGIRGRLAATLLAMMFGSWVFIVHSPRVAAQPTSADEWSSLIIALSCCGASWIMRESLASSPSRQAAARR